MGTLSKGDAGRRTTGVSGVASLAAVGALGVAVLLGSPALPSVGGAGTGELEAQQAPSQAGGDYLLEQPRVTLTARMGVSLARAGSDFFEFATDEFTLDRGDFHSQVVGGELAFRITERLDLTAGLSSARAEQSSEYRDWEGEDGLPVEQVTRLRQTPLILGLRAYLQPRGESIGQFVWIPARVRPYVGAGAGAIYHSLVQEGEFIDFEDLGIFEDRFESNGWGRAGHLLAGVDLGLTPRVSLNLEGRYQWAEADLDGRQFRGFEPLDLSGFQTTLGVGFSF